MPYRTELLCPVCGSHLDTIEHPNEKLEGMAEAMMGGDARRAHAQASPDCVGGKGWSRGWDAKPLGFVSQETLDAEAAANRAAALPLPPTLEEVREEATGHRPVPASLTKLAGVYVLRLAGDTNDEVFSICPDGRFKLGDRYVTDQQAVDWLHAFGIGAGKVLKERSGEAVIDAIEAQAAEPYLDAPPSRGLTIQLPMPIKFAQHWHDTRLTRLAHPNDYKASFTVTVLGRSLTYQGLFPTQFDPQEANPVVTLSVDEIKEEEEG